MIGWPTSLAGGGPFYLDEGLGVPSTRWCERRKATTYHTATGLSCVPSVIASPINVGYHSKIWNIFFLSCSAVLDRASDHNSSTLFKSRGFLGEGWGQPPDWVGKTVSYSLFYCRLHHKRCMQTLRPGQSHVPF